MPKRSKRSPQPYYERLPRAVVAEPVRKTTASGDYREESSDRVVKGSVTVARDAWWSVELLLPLSGDQPALLNIARHGGDQTLGPSDASLVVPPAEMDAVVRLLGGVAEHARRDGVLPPGNG